MKIKNTKPTESARTDSVKYLISRIARELHFEGELLEVEAAGKNLPTRNMAITVKTILQALANALLRAEDRGQKTEDRNMKG